MLELRARRREELLAGADVVIHGTAHVEQQQHLHCVVALRAHLHVEQAGVPGRLADGGVDVELLRGPLAGELAQPAQRHLDVAGAKLQGVVVVAEAALVPHLHRPAVA